MTSMGKRKKINYPESAEGGGDSASFRTAYELLNDVKRMRDDAKRKILLKGLLPKIKTELWPRVTKEATFEDLCKAALNAESIVIQKDLSEDKSVVVATIQKEQMKEQEKELAQRQTQIDLLKEQNEFLKLIHGKNDSQEKAEEASTVGAVNSHTPQNGILKSGNKNVHFKQTSRNQGTGNSNPNSRSSSRERINHPKGKDYQNKLGQLVGFGPYGPYQGPYPGFWIPQQGTQNSQNQGFNPFAQHQLIGNPQTNQFASAQPQIGQHTQQFPNQFQQPFIPFTQFQNQPQQSQAQAGPHKANWGQRNQNREQENPKQGGKRDVICHCCGKKGHYARECWNNPNNQTQKQ